MQGRLSPPQGDLLQFFPQDWRAEFDEAKRLGFDGVTWFLDRDIPGFDPIDDIWGDASQISWIDDARKKLPLHSIDCGMYPLFGEGATETLEKFEILFRGLGPRLQSRTLALPLLEKIAPHTTDEKKEAQKNLSTLAAFAASHGLLIALETEMSGQELAEFISGAHADNVGVCYDIGNSTSYGADCPQEIRSLGSLILEVHLKDRKKGSTQSVKLGEGDADFAGCFAALKEIGYAHGYTMQAWRGADYLADAAQQLKYIRDLQKT